MDTDFRIHNLFFTKRIIYRSIYILFYRILNKKEKKRKKEEAQGDDSTSLGYIKYVKKY